ncbi:MAG: hypothetical protein U9Q07_00290 [Planctomycetota bacterium]|nr:hypothetical protein [Planctomycetota bacterium]
MQHETITVEFRGITFAVGIDYDPDDEMDYHHTSIKPDGDDADFLDFFRDGPEWSAMDRAIDRAWNDWINTRGVDVMDRVRDERLEKGAI